jgi:hypothetical protein
LKRRKEIPFIHHSAVLAMTAPSSQCQVRVGVRIRPVTSQEIKQGGKQVLDVAPPAVGIGERQFTYDALFDSHVSQQELYTNVSKPLLGSFVDGYNATVSKQQGNVSKCFSSHFFRFSICTCFAHCSIFNFLIAL